MAAPELAEVPAASSGREPAAVSRSRTWASAPVTGAVLGGLIVLGLVVRVIVARQSLFADELSTYWIVATHSLRGVMSLMYGNDQIQHAEITPPVYFVASWFTSQFGHAPLLLRLPSLVAGTLTIPLVYAVGRRTVGRPAGLLAATVTTLASFMIYYSAEARSYGVMMFLLTLSTLSLLLALDSGRRRWWVLYAVAEWGAFLTHYTCIFVLAAQLAWVLWTRPEARRPALLATAGAVALFLPWIPGFLNDLHSPTTKILSALSPFTWTDVRLSLEHWSLGYPYVVGGGLGKLPGTPALIVLGAAMLLVAGGLAARARELGAIRLRAALQERYLLVFLLLLATPVGEALQSAVSTHTFGVRNLASSWPSLALACSALVMWSGRRVRIAATALVVISFLFPAVKMLSKRWARPDFQGAANLVARQAHHGDVVIDSTGVLSPGPLTGLDLVLRPPGPVIRAARPQERDHPFTLFDPDTPLPEAVRLAVASAGGRRVFVVTYPNSQLEEHLPAPYRMVEDRVFRGFLPVEVRVWAIAGSSAQ